ncbi:MAG: hypothetical protein COX65_06495 [Elusimicrobia bacterium CG_4_10_14_0_2_um_filter_56_8]|nr:MAG: hypothetical protein AUJ51_13115 [Elusimicrobia bacterium CG1_02_56_21]PJA13829.1 MAG: hypothetical protein COX65_06495 [Elusimicrobia bacterium CG_4_10_14_0_2_um_filter_56_8]
MIFQKKKSAPKSTAAEYILGVCAFDSEPSAALIRDGKVLFEASEGELSGRNIPGIFPSSAVTEALSRASEAEGTILGVKDLAAVAFHEKPLLKYERFLETWLANAPGGTAYFKASSHQAFLAKRAGSGLLNKELAAVSWGEEPQLSLFPEYLLSGAASAFYRSPFEDAAVLVLDGPGEWASAAIAIGSGEKIKILKEILFPDSPGRLCSALAAFAGLKTAKDLFTRAIPSAAATSGKDYAGLIRSELAELREDGSLRLNTRYFNPAAGMEPDYYRWTELFKLPEGIPGGELTPEHSAFAAAALQVLEAAFFMLAAQAKRLTGSNSLCLAGSSPLNLAAGGKLKTSGIFSGIRVQPPAPAAGRAAGAALAARHLYFGAKRVPSKPGAGAPETPPPVSVREGAPAKPGAAAFIRAYLYYYLSVVPAALLRRIKGETGPLIFKKPVAGTPLYATRNRLYSREDLENPF